MTATEPGDRASAAFEVAHLDPMVVAIPSVGAAWISGGLTSAILSQLMLDSLRIRASSRSKTSTEGEFTQACV